MKKILYILFLLPLFSNSAVYYVSNTGNDSNNGTTTGTAWKTLAKVNSSSFSAGDTIKLQYDGIWNEQLTLASAGTILSRLVLTSYGSGTNAPYIKNMDTLKTWTSIGGGLYTCTDANLGTSVNLLTINGVQQPLGRYPKTTYNTYQSYSTSPVSITDSSLPDSPSFVGAQIVVRYNHWVNWRGTVTSQSGGVITYTKESGTGTYTPKNNFGYFFQNHVNCLSQFGDWMYNSSTHVVTMYFGANNPNSYVVKATTNTACITINAAYNSIIGINIEGGDYGVYESTTQNYTLVQNCYINNCGINGINFSSGFREKVTGCTITNCNGNAIAEKFGQYDTLSNNIIKNIQIYPGMCLSGDANGCGILINGTRNTSTLLNVVTNNNVTNVGYCPIYVDGDQFTIQYNNCDSFAFIKDDVGGVYTYTGYPIYTYTNRIISNNIVQHGIGAPAGTALPISSGAHGIYLDDNTNGVIASNNVVAHMQAGGVKVNGSFNCSIINNLIFDCANGGFDFGSVMFDLSNNDSVMSNMTFTNNNIITNNDQQLNVAVQNTQTGATTSQFSTWGVFNNNVYMNPFYNKFLFTNYVNSDPYPGYSRRFSDWQALTGFETNGAIKAPATIGQFTASNITQVWAQPFNTSQSATVGTTPGSVAYTNGTMTFKNTQMAGYNIQVVPTSGITYIKILAGNISSSNQYLLTFATQSTAYGGIQVYLQGSIQNDYGLYSYIPVVPYTTNHTVYFSTPVTTANDTLVIAIPPQYLNTLRLNNMVFSTATLTPVSLAGYMNFTVNPSTNGTTVTLGSSAVDYNNVYQASGKTISIPAYGGYWYYPYSSTIAILRRQVD
jgi:Right handed beta helix region